MDEKMHFMTEPEELLNWMKEHEEFKVMNKEDAQILLNYMEGHDYRLGTDKEALSEWISILMSMRQSHIHLMM